MWVQVIFHVTPGTEELALAAIADLPFTMFEDDAGRVIAYGIDTAVTTQVLTDLLKEKDAPWHSIEVNMLKDENWNQVWESNYDPVDIAPFCYIRAPFHAPVPGVYHDLIIHPGMAFGTGHHATTKMMVQGMEPINFAGKKVLDFGCGTGVLAILAARMGASSVDGVEIEKIACESASENLLLNQVEGNVRIFNGTLDVLADKVYDVILANINRNVILESLATLESMLLPGGILGMSGFLLRDEAVLFAAGSKLGWEKIHQSHHSDWLSMWWKKPL